MSDITVTEAEQRRAQEQILEVGADVEIADDMLPGALHTPRERSMPACPDSIGPAR